MTYGEWKAVAIYALVALGAIAVGAFAEYRAKRKALRRVVFRDLDSAADNGYFAPGGSLHGMTPYEIAQDMTMYAEDYEQSQPRILTPHVRAWLRKGDLL